MMLTFSRTGVKNIHFANSCGTGFLLLLIFISFSAKAIQKPNGNENNWYISGSTGIAILSKEITKNFVFLKNEFNHQPGFTYDLSASRTFGVRWEPSLRLSVYTLTGNSNNPNFSASGYHDPITQMNHQAPVEYITQSSSVSLILRYHFNWNQGKDEDDLKIAPFFEAGAGINSFKSELRYKTAPSIEESSLIFKKHDNGYPFGVAQIVTGLGTKIGGNGKWNFVILWNTEWINYDCLDAVYNFSEGERNHAKGIVFRLTAGISIPIKSAVKKDNYLPFRW
jgi:hypothetical protein